MAKFTNRPKAMAGMRKHIKLFEKELHTETMNTALTVTRAFFQRTPVWSGETIVNYAWGNNRHNRAKQSPSGSWRGSNVGVPLGSEQNRSSNESRVIGQLASMYGRFKIGKTLMLTNNVGEKWDLVENGAAPTPDRARNPGGVTKLAMQMAMSRIDSTIWKRGGG